MVHFLTNYDHFDAEINLQVNFLAAESIPKASGIDPKSQ